MSGNAYMYWDTGYDGFSPTGYNNVLRPVCTYYGENDPGPGIRTMTCQPGELPIGWQFIKHPYNPSQNYAHVVLNVMCIYAPDTQ